jgi:hypothetical protein
LPGLFLLSATLPKTVPSDNGLRKLPNVVLFKAGEHTDMRGRTKDYTPEYVRGLAAATETLRTAKGYHIEPPAVLGHELVQAKLAEILSGDDVFKTYMAGDKPTSGGGPFRTDQLAGGWPENFRFDPAAGHMVADFDRIPPSIADLIETGQIRYPSIEIKPDVPMPDGTKADAVCRVAWLGGNPPGCKTIPPLGAAAFADMPADVVCFADAGGADPLPAAVEKPVRTLLARLRKLSADFVSKLTRPQIDQLAADTAAELAAAGEPVPAEIAAMSDANKSTPLSDADRKALVDAIRGEVVAAFADREKALDDKANAIRAAADAAQKAIDRRAAEETRKDIMAFCEAERGVHLPPALIDAPDPAKAHLTIPHFMYTLDHQTPVTCFADGDTEVKKTQLEIFKDMIRTWPVRMFGSRLQDALPATDARAAQKKEIREALERNRQPAGAK